MVRKSKLLESAWAACPYGQNKSLVRLREVNMRLSIHENRNGIQDSRISIAHYCEHSTQIQTVPIFGPYDEAVLRSRRDRTSAVGDFSQADLGRQFALVCRWPLAMSASQGNAGAFPSMWRFKKR